MDSHKKVKIMLKAFYIHRVVFVYICGRYTPLYMDLAHSAALLLRAATREVKVWGRMPANSL